MQNRGVLGVCKRETIMTHDSKSPRDTNESPAERYAGFGTEDSFVLYDTENAAAWIEADATLPIAEMV